MARRKYIHNQRRHYSHRKKNSPFKQVPLLPKPPTTEKEFDRMQTGLSFAGILFPPADALNAGVSAVRGLASRHKYKKSGDPAHKDAANKHFYAAGMNTAAIIPGLKEIDWTTKNYNRLRKFGNFEYWRGTAKQIIKDIKGGYNENKSPIKKLTHKYGI